ncbi:MAG: hypothetical protein D6729_16835, partial [Deltaproteobacteria bacterium]
MTNGEKGEKPPPSRARTTLRERWEQLLEGEGRAGRAFHTILLTLLAVGIAWLLTPARGIDSYPEAKDLGTFVDRNIKAPTDFTVPDEETTKRKREEARRRVRAVYDFDRSAADEIAKRVHEAFGLMQNVAAKWRMRQGEDGSVAEAAVTGAIAGGVAGVAAPSALRATRGPRSATLAQAAFATRDPLRVRFDAQRDAFQQILQVVVSDEAFDLLARENFAPRIERAVARLLRHAMRRPIVPDRKLLAADRGRGIVIRPVPARDRGEERVVEDIDAEVLDLPAIRAELSEAASAELPEARPDVVSVVSQIARRLVRPNLSYNREETVARQEAAAASVKPTVIQVQRGEKIIGDGERIEPRHLLIFDGLRAQARSGSGLQVFIGGALLALLAALSLYAFARRGMWRFRPSRKDVLTLVLFLFSTLLAMRLGLVVTDALSDHVAGVSADLLRFALPAGAAVLLVRQILPGEITLVFASVLALLTGILVDRDLGFAIYV